MNRRLVFLSAFAAILLVSVVGYAQQRGQRGQRGMGMMGRGMGVARIVQNEAVQKELGVTDEQATKLRELMAAGRGQGGGRGNFQDMTDEERQKMREEMAKRQEEQEKKIAEILNKDQMKRLHQIEIQAMGSRAFMNEDVAKELGITEEQQQKMRDAGREAMQEMRDAAQGGGPPDREAMSKMMEKMNAKMMEVLTDEQKAKYKDMVGKPFDTSSLMGGRGGRRGGQGN